jgi:hypothetical protein
MNGLTGLSFNTRQTSFDGSIDVADWIVTKRLKVSETSELDGGVDVGSTRLSVGRLSGLLTPASPTDAATRQYVDDEVAVNANAIGTTITNANAYTDSKTGANTALITLIEDKTVFQNVSGLETSFSNIVHVIEPTANTHAASRFYVDTGDAAILNSKGATNGICPLSGGLVPNSHMPPLAISSVHVYATVSSRDSSVGNEEGDVAVVTDENKTYIYDSGGNWQELVTTGTFSTVNMVT